MIFPHAAHLNPAGWAHLLLFGILLPAQVARNARRIAHRTDAMPPRIAHFQSSLALLLLCVAISVLVARVQRVALFPPGVPHIGRGLLAGVAMYVAAVLFMRPRWRQAVLRRDRKVHYFMPENATERAWWLGISVVAGVGEEITWRGVQTALLLPLTENYWIAAGLSAVSFGVAHAIQGWKSVVVIVCFGLGFQAVVVASGSLYVAMAVHVAYDITAGLTYAKLARDLGYVPDL